MLGTMCVTFMKITSTGKTKALRGNGVRDTMATINAH